MYGDGPLRRWVSAVVWTCLSALGGLHPLQAQSTDWTPMLKQGGVSFDFILHRFGDGVNDGVVVRLINHNDHPVDFRFKMVFRGDDRVHTTPPVEGRLKAGELRTGESAGFWWIPFKDGTAVQEVGMRGFRIEAVPDEERPNEAETSSGLSAQVPLRGPVDANQ